MADRSASERSTDRRAEPIASPGAARSTESEPSADLDVLMVGAGFSGLYLLHRLREEGFRVRLVEAASGVGGVWRNNAYPGCRVDTHVPNYELSLEAVWRGWTWSERFPGRDELLAYFDHVVEVLDLRREIDVDTRVERARFDPAADRWDVTTSGGRRYEPRYVAMCTGFASKAYIPDLPGLGSFAGPCHHTAHWPEPGVDLAGKRVGVIGTGASGVQVIQEASKVAAKVVVFQRSPVLALPMGQRRLDDGDQAAGKSGYPEFFARRDSPPTIGFADVPRRADAGVLDVSADERREVFDRVWAEGGLHFWFGTFSDVLVDETANRVVYDYWRERTRARIDDPEVAALLAPDEPPYPFGTKRPSLEVDYYECFNRSNVELVDVRSTPIDAVTPTGIRTTGGPAVGTTAGASAGISVGTDGGERVRDHDLDVLVLATGFDANTGGLTSIDIVGTSGVSLAEQWSDGVDTLFGIGVPDFPNLLLLYGPQSATAFCTGPSCAEIQGDWTVELLDHARREGSRRFDVDPSAARRWSAELAEIADRTLFGRTDSWYMAANVPGKKRQLLNYPSSDMYVEHLRASTAAGYPGFEFAE